MHNFTTENVSKEKNYTFMELAKVTGLPVAIINEEVGKNSLICHWTDDTQMINGKNFLHWAAKHDGERDDIFS